MLEDYIKSVISVSSGISKRPKAKWHSRLGYEDTKIGIFSIPIYIYNITQTIQQHLSKPLPNPFPTPIDYTPDHFPNLSHRLYISLKITRPLGSMPSFMILNSPSAGVISTILNMPVSSCSLTTRGTTNSS